MLAARNGNPAAIETFVTAGADVNAVESVRGTTALMWAVEQGHPAAVRALVDAGADVSAHSGAAGLPRVYMAQRVNIGNVREAQDTLREAAASGLTQEEYQRRRAEQGEGEDEGPGNPRGGGRFGGGPDLGLIVDLVLNQAERDEVEPSEVLSGFEDQVAEFGVDIDLLRRAVEARLAGEELPEGNQGNRRGFGGGQGRFPAGQGARADEAGDDTDEAGDDEPEGEADGPRAGLVGGDGGGLTPLIYAAREGCFECARVLVESGADVNQWSHHGWTPLLTATNNRWFELGVYLIEQGADVNLANEDEMSPLYLATDVRNIEGGDYPVPDPDMDTLEYIRILLENGADPNQTVAANTETRTIFTMQWFFESGATPFVRAAQSGDTELMRLLLEHGADPNHRTDHGDTALSAAAGIGWVDGVTYEWSSAENLEAVQMLLDLGVDPNTQNNDGRTPLMGAAMKGRLDVIEALVAGGASLDTRDFGSRDTDKTGSILAGHTWQAIDYADGLVRVGVQSAVNHPEVATRLRSMMIERDLAVPPPNRVVDSICIVEICMEPLVDSLDELTLPPGDEE
jgi:ankyrin repeat protein